jgi:hypothetical protein
MKNVRLLMPLLMILLITGCGFAAAGYAPAEVPGFFDGIWHGLLAPWTLILRIFMDIKMYAFPNSGWFYDFGFLIGVVFSLPVGWLAAVIATIVHVL